MRVFREHVRAKLMKRLRRAARPGLSACARRDDAGLAVGVAARRRRAGVAGPDAGRGPEPWIGLEPLPRNRYLSARGRSGSGGSGPNSGGPGRDRLRSRRPSDPLPRVRK